MTSATPTETPVKVRMLWAVALGLAAMAALQVWSLLHFQPAGLDFLPLWTAGQMAWTHPAAIYDFHAVTAAQAWQLPNFPWMRPYANPPSALLVLAPLGALPFWVALGIWTVGGLAAFLWAGMRLAGERHGLAAMLMALSPAVVLALVAGQATLPVAALLTLAMVELNPRPKLAGALFAIAAALKPQALLLAPVAMIAGGAIDALVVSAIVGLALVVASAALFGPSRWVEWVQSLPAFQAVIEATPRFVEGLVTPTGLGRQLGLAGAALTLWRLVFALAGVGLVGFAFTRPLGSERRLAALVVGSLCVTPYALCYDAALLAPAAATLMVTGMEERGWPRRAGAFGAACAATVPGLGFVAVVAFAGLALWPVGARTAIAAEATA